MLAILLLPLLQLVLADPFWIIRHDKLLSTRMDPVVNPGGVSGHVHAIVGGSGFEATYDYASLQASKCTTANIAIDKSNYWVPQLYRKTSSGLKLVPNTFTNTYYLVRRQPNEVVYEFPPGFRMLAGDMHRTTYNGQDRAQAAINYVCLGGNLGYQPNNFPTRNCPDGLRAQAYFPSCWDGINLWLEGSKHVAYPMEGPHDQGGKCPSTHPKRIVGLFYEFVFQDNFPYESNARVWSHGDQTGYGFHADFTNGWPEGQFQKIMDQGNTCSVGFSLEKCPALAPHMKQSGGCAPERMVVDEIIDPVSKLPGNNPIYGAGGPNRPAYTETAMFKAIGPALPTNWNKLGCIKEPASGRALSAATQSTDDMNPTKCMQFCAGKGYKLAGVEWGRECFCGNSVATGTSETPDPSAICSNACAGEGNSKGFCGGSRTLTLYKFAGSGTPNVGASAGGSVQPKPVTISQVKATTIRQMSMKGDPGYPANNKIITLAKRSRSRD